MSTTNLTLQGAFTLLTCGVEGCGIAFAVHQERHQRWEDTGEWFYCPNGHHIHYSETEAMKLRRDVAQKTAQIDRIETDLRHAREQRDSAEHSAAIVKGQSRAIKKRIKNGVCPCCHRSFLNLKAHMEGQHPDYAKEATEAAR